ncbi:hypothetical protein L596_030448 [Steinernema carpocapsae]|uniref:Uncharacterized protein n=1 Tax=Steinernema carpocapsae TaxID=34508 RepID=A0A4V5ZWY4_STECR|nr:hypothetical protein L596_030448 [Steinernema carpocapsae]
MFYKLSAISMNHLDRDVCNERLSSVGRLKVSIRQMCTRVPAINIRMGYHGGPIVHMHANVSTLYKNRFFDVNSDYGYSQVGVLSYTINALTEKNVNVALRTSLYCGFIEEATRHSYRCAIFRK